jgi:hypothetical protein
MGVSSVYGQFVPGSAVMLGHLVYNGHIDDSAYTWTNARGWLTRLWNAFVHLKL